MLLINELSVWCFILSWFYRTSSSLSGSTTCRITYSTWQLAPRFYVHLVNSYQHPMEWYSMQAFLSPFHRWRNQGSGWAKAFLKMTQLRTAKAKTGSNLRTTTLHHLHIKHEDPHITPTGHILSSLSNRWRDLTAFIQASDFSLSLLFFTVASSKGLAQTCS